MPSAPDIRTFYELQPNLPLSEGWHWLLFVCLLVVVAVWTIWVYRRDTKHLRRPTSWLLTGLRLVALTAIVIYILGPGKRSETKLTKDSRLAVVVDTSLSMGLVDQSGTADPDTADPSGKQPRINAVIQWAAREQSIEKLRQQHEVSVYRLGDQSRPELISTFSKLKSAATDQNVELSRDGIQSEVLRQGLAQSRQIGLLAIGLAALALIQLVAWMIGYLRGSTWSAIWSATGLAFVILSVCTFAVSDLLTPQFDFLTSVGFGNRETAPMPVVAEVNLPGENESGTDEASELLPKEIDWQKELAARGTSTKLGSAIQYIVNRERSGPFAGLVLFTDGRSNSGVLPEVAIAAATNASISIYPVGIGSTLTPKNVQVAEIQAPPRVFPGDRFQVKGLVTPFGCEGQTVRVELVSVDEQETEAEILEAEDNLRLGPDGQPMAVQFSIEQQNQGRRRYTIRAIGISEDSDPRDNQRSAVVEIVERTTKVLLVAGGPSREFRFLRNQLYRDKDITLHVWLQSSKEGADQESDLLLQAFPDSREEFDNYDCVIGFDPDWRALSPAQSSMLERWVAEKAGGMIVIAGPVNTPRWTRQPRGDESVDKIRRLYPVSFYAQGSAVLRLGRFGGDESFPLKFTREGRAAEYLWLGDSAGQSQETWGQFEGVFGYYAVNEPKAGAEVLANFADPDTLVSERLPIYLASHFYGSGRVFFQASGEMWRVRRLSVEYFQGYYTKLIRWATQGRLLRDSSQGVVLTDRQRCWMGDSISVQAILRDAQDDPLLLPEVTATILRPDESTEPIVLRSSNDAVSPGTFSSQFIAAQEGDYRISLAIPDSPNLEVLTATVVAKIPDLEKERPQRNDELLAEIAEKTQGHYYVGLKEFSVNEEDPMSPHNLIQPRDQETFLTGTFDRFFQRKLMMWLLGLFATALSLEWIVRRLHKLA
jgi:hypothetical protein